MARTEITVQEAAAAGSELTTEAANVDGNSFLNDGNTLLYVVNGSASPVTVTLQTPAQQAGLDIAEQAWTVPAGETWKGGRFAPSIYNRPAGDPDAGKVYVDYSAVASVTVAVIEP